MVMEADMSGFVANPERSLVGKFFTSLVPPSFDRTESTLRQQWELTGGLKVLSLEKDNIILFEFEKKREKNKVVKRGPWNVDGIILVLKECTQDISMADIDFSVACFWVKVIGLPKLNYTVEDAEKIVKNLSDKPYIMLICDDTTRWFWVRAEIDLKKPLTPGFYINGKSRRRPFVQFKYKNLGEFCENCGMISHRKCGEVAKMRPLTREFKTHVYGPWLRSEFKVLANNDLPVKLHYSCDEVGLEYEETVTSAQFVVRVVVDAVYASEHEWGSKKLIRSLKPETAYPDEYVFRFPCFPTRVIKDVVAFEIDRMSPLVKLTAEDKASIVHGLVDCLMKQRKTWSKQRWVRFLVRVEETIMIPPVDMEALLEEAKDQKLHHTIDLKVCEMIDTPLGKSDDLLRKTIRDAIREVGLTQFPDFLVESLMGWVKSTDYVSKLRLDPKFHKIVKVLGPDMDLFGTCCICQEEFFLGQDATCTSCSHVFHSHCIEEWIQESQKCPLCCVQLQVFTNYH